MRLIPECAGYQLVGLVDLVGLISTNAENCQKWDDSS